MTHRNSALLYIFLLMTGGLYYFLWMGIVERDLNELEGKKSIRSFIIAPLLTIILIALVVVSISRGEVSSSDKLLVDYLLEALVVIIALTHTVYVLYFHSRLTAYLKERGVKVPSTTTVNIFYFFVFYSFVLLQNGINSNKNLHRS